MRFKCLDTTTNIECSNYDIEDKKLFRSFKKTFTAILADILWVGHHCANTYRWKDYISDEILMWLVIVVIPLRNLLLGSLSRFWHSSIKERKKISYWQERKRDCFRCNNQPPDRKYPYHNRKHSHIVLPRNL